MHADSQPMKPVAGLDTFFGFLFASVGYVALQLVLTPVRIRLMTTLLTKDQYGILTLVIMTVSFLATAASLGSFEYLLRKVPGHSEAYQMGLLKVAVKYFGGLSLGLAAVGAAGFLLLRGPGSGLSGYAVAGGAVAVVLYLHLLQKTFFLLGRSQLFRFRVTQFLYADIWFVPLILLLLVYPLSITMILWVWVGWLLFTVLATWRWAPLGEAFAQPDTNVKFREMLHFGFPLLPMIFGDWLFRLGDRYLLLLFRDIEAVANYTLCMNISLIGFLVGLNLIGLILPEFNRVKNTLAPEMYERPWESQRLRRLFSVMLRYALVFALVGGIVLFAAGDHLLAVLSGPDFRDAAFLFPWAAPLSLFFLLQAVFNRTLLSLDRSRLVGGLTVGGAALNLLLNWWLIPAMGERGAALATCLSLAALSAAAGAFVRAWRWIDWQELMPARLAFTVCAAGAGILLACRYLAFSSFLVLGASALWCVLLIFGAGMLRREDLRLFYTKRPPAGPPAMPPIPETKP